MLTVKLACCRSLVGPERDVADEGDEEVMVLLGGMDRWTELEVQVEDIEIEMVECFATVDIKPTRPATRLLAFRKDSKTDDASLIVAH